MRIVETYDATLKGLQPLIKSLSGYPERYNGKYPELQHFFDRALNGALAQVDLTIGLKHLIVSFQEGRHIEANYFARAMAVTAYDILLKSGQLVGKEVREFVMKHISTSKYYAEAAQYVKQINQMKLENEHYLKEIRNNVFGHKDGNGLKQFEMINKLEINKVNRICYELQMKNHDLVGSILYLTGEIEEYLNAE